MREQIKEVRKLLKENGADVFITADSDNHLSETCTEHFRCMKYISGFTGGDGYLLVTDEKAALWTDGRYFIQAEEELKDSGIALMRMGERDCPEMKDWIGNEFPEGAVIGFDGKCMAYSFVNELRSLCCELKDDLDIMDQIWPDRPEPAEDTCWILPESCSGRSTGEKLSDVFNEMDSKAADICIVTDPEDIAWLLNMRGNDLPYTPVFFSYAVIDRKKGISLYVSEKHLTSGIREYLKGPDIHIYSLCTDTDRFFDDISLFENVKVIADRRKSSYSVISALSETVEILDVYSPCTLLKNRKNSTEMENLRNAQIKDSVAVTKFMHYFKKKVSGENLSVTVKNEDRKKVVKVSELLKVSEDLTERSLAEKLHGFRMEQEGFLGESFPTISAYGPGAAMCHYNTFEGEDVVIRPRGLYLVDSGGHYPEGTTDVTRTWACGPVTDHEKRMYTITAVSNLRLAASVFPEGTSMLTLDYPSRELFWKQGLNFNHGTGHGVGYLLNVHEGPSGIRYRADDRSADNCAFEGVYVSDEPGFYKEGEFGIRLENMLLAVKDRDTEYGKFLRFETLTLVPFDRDCMMPELMTEDDIRLYNVYHEKVYRTLKAYMTDEERAWLAKACRSL